MRPILVAALLVLAAVGAGADELVGKLTRVETSRIHLVVDGYPREVAIDLAQGVTLPAGTKVGNFLKVEYTEQRVAVAQGGQRVCLQARLASHIERTDPPKKPK